MITESSEPFLPCTGRLTPLGGATRLPCLYCDWPTDVLSSSCEGCLMASRRQPRLKKRSPLTAEEQRLEENARREQHWKRWGPYLSERAWGTVREDYSASGTAWEAFPHEHARSRAYRWNEDGLAGLCDRHQYICFGLALWNGHDPILKERLFGLTGHEGNHGEDVKEYYFYL